jgi:hypothetical protein
MSNNKLPWRKPWRVQAPALWVLLLWACAGCARPAPPVATGGLSAERHQDLLIGYGLLADTLSDESRLGTLDVFKTLMLDAPNDEVSKLMKTLSDASEKRAAQLAKLREQAPKVSQKPAEDSAIGDAINDIAKDLGKSEMLSRKGGFDIRFVLVQAQATRMVAAMAKATARFDPNPERKVWLKELAVEYEGYRGDLIKYLGGQQATK